MDSNESSPQLARRVRLVLNVLVGAPIVATVLGIVSLAVGQLPYALASIPGHLDKPTLPVTATPEQVARRYYEAQSAGDAAALAAVSWQRPNEARPTPQPCLRWLTSIEVEPTWATGNSYGATFSEVRETSVDYHTVVAAEPGDTPGPDGRFVVLGRLKTSGCWVFIESGTGP